MRRSPLVQREEQRPLDQLPAGLVQHPGADRHDQSTALGQPDELRGRYRAAFRVIPADECLHPDNGSVLQRKDWLVFEAELTTLECLREFPPDRVPRDRLIANTGVEELVVVAATFLGLVHRGVRVSDEILATGVRIVGDDHPDARGDAQLDAVVEERLTDATDNSIS